MLMFEKAKRKCILCTGSSNFVINTYCNPKLKQKLYDKCL